MHADRYYPLKVEHFKSTLDTQLLDMLWNKYWVSTLAQSPVIVNRSYTVGQLEDLGEKMKRSEASIARKGHALPSASSMPGGNNEGGGKDASEAKEARARNLMTAIKKREGESPLFNVASDGCV